MRFLLNLGLEHLQSGVRLVATEADQIIRFDHDGPTTFIASSEAQFSAEWRKGCLLMNIDAYEAEYAEPEALSFDRIRELVESNARLQRPVDDVDDVEDLGEICEDLGIENVEDLNQEVR